MKFWLGKTSCWKVRIKVHGDGFITSKGKETIEWSTTYNVKARDKQNAERLVKNDVPSELKIDECVARQVDEKEFMGRIDFEEGGITIWSRK
jgi:hypothetical protein